MIETMYFTLTSDLAAYHRTGALPERRGDKTPANTAPYGRYRCKDGWIALICVSEDQWARVLDVNTMGPVRVLDAFTDRLAAAGNAKAVTLTSGMGSIGDVGSGRQLMYRTSKAAVNMAMRARSLTLAPRGITVVVMNPGWVRTDMGGPGGSISPEESVRAMRGIIDALTPEQAGSFLNWRGGGYPW